MHEPLFFGPYTALAFGYQWGPITQTTRADIDARLTITPRGSGRAMMMHLYAVEQDECSASVYRSDSIAELTTDLFGEDNRCVLWQTDGAIVLGGPQTSVSVRIAPLLAKGRYVGIWVLLGRLGTESPALSVLLSMQVVGIAEPVSDEDLMLLVSQRRAATSMALL